MAKADLVVIDNLATLARGFDDNRVESWQPVQEWLLSLRRMGKAVLLVHHAGKSGGQRGSSAKEDILETVIRLSRPSDYGMDQGCRFEVHLTKARTVLGTYAQPFEAWLQDGEWLTRDLEDGRVVRIRELLEIGMSVKDIATELDVHRSTVYRIISDNELKAPGAQVSHVAFS